jgi:hypothetical protein
MEEKSHVFLSVTLHPYTGANEAPAKLIVLSSGTQCKSVEGQPTFQRNMPPPSLGLLFIPEDVGNMFL